MKKVSALLLPVITAFIFVPAIAEANSGDFSGGVAIGTGYAGVSTAPTNGLIVQGSVGIGTGAPTTGAALDLSYNTGSIFMPVGTTGQRPAATTNGQIRYNTSLNSIEAYANGGWQDVLSSATTPVFSSGQLRYGSATQVQYCPYKGNMKTLAGTAGIYTIPSGCLASTITSAYLNGTAGQALANSTLYYAYLYNASGTEVIDWSTTGHATDSTNGVEEKSGDATRTLIGMIYVNASGQISASNTQGSAAWTVATWDNRVPTTCRNYFSTNRTTTSTTLVEINSEIRCTFMSWGDSAVIASSQEVSNNTAGQAVVMLITIDGTSTFVGQNLFTSYAANTIGGDPIAASYLPSEGQHYVTIIGDIGGAGSGTATFYGATDWPLTVSVNM